MKYETPELTALTPAIDAILSSLSQKTTIGFDSASGQNNDVNGAYQEWE